MKSFSAWSGDIKKLMNPEEKKKPTYTFKDMLFEVDGVPIAVDTTKRYKAGPGHKLETSLVSGSCVLTSTDVVRQGTIADLIGIPPMKPWGLLRAQNGTDNFDGHASDEFSSKVVVKLPPAPKASVHPLFNWNHDPDIDKPIGKAIQTDEGFRFEPLVAKDDPLINIYEGFLDVYEEMVQNMKNTHKWYAEENCPVELGDLVPNLPVLIEFEDHWADIELCGTLLDSENIDMEFFKDQLWDLGAIYYQYGEIKVYKAINDQTKSVLEISNTLRKIIKLAFWDAQVATGGGQEWLPSELRVRDKRSELHDIKGKNENFK